METAAEPRTPENYIGRQQMSGSELARLLTVTEEKYVIEKVGGFDDLAAEAHRAADLALASQLERWEAELDGLAARAAAIAPRVGRRPPRHTTVDNTTVPAPADAPRPKQRRMRSSTRALDTEPALDTSVPLPLEEMAALRFEHEVAVMEKSRLVSENEQLRRALADRDGELASAQGAVETARRDAAALRSRVQELESIVRGLEARSKAQAAQLESAVKRAEAFRAKGHEACEAFEHEAAQMEEERQEAEARAEAFEAELKETREMWRTATAAASENEAEAEREAARRARAEAALKRAEEERAAREAEARKATADAAVLRKSLFGKLADLSRLALEAKATEGRLARAHAALLQAGLPVPE